MNDFSYFEDSFLIGIETKTCACCGTTTRTSTRS